MENIIFKIKNTCPISDTSIEQLKKLVTPCHFSKNHQLVRANDFCKYAYFIEKGLTRSFWLVDGEEITTSFSFEGDIVFSMDELYYGKCSEEYVETLEECFLYKISLTNLIHLWNNNMEFCIWARVIHQNEYRRLHRSHKERLSLPAKERYEEFQKQFPTVCRRTKLGFIASYLGITLETLSRIRASK